LIACINSKWVRLDKSNEFAEAVRDEINQKNQEVLSKYYDDKHRKFKELRKKK
jgi:hypothetical protein